MNDQLASLLRSGLKILGTLMNDQLASLLRSGLKILGTYLVSKGIGNGTVMEEASGGVMAVAGILWSYWHHREATPPTLIPKA